MRTLTKSYFNSYRESEKENSKKIKQYEKKFLACTKKEKFKTNISAASDDLYIDNNR